MKVCRKLMYESEEKLEFVFWKIQKIYLEEVLKMILKMNIYMFITPFWNIIKFCKWIMNNCQDWVKGFHEMVLWTGICKVVVFQNRATCNRLHPLCKSIAWGFQQLEIQIFWVCNLFHKSVNRLHVKSVAKNDSLQSIAQAI